MSSEERGRAGERRRRRRGGDSEVESLLFRGGGGPRRKSEPSVASSPSRTRDERRERRCSGRRPKAEPLLPRPSRGRSAPGRIYICASGRVFFGIVLLCRVSPGRRFLSLRYCLLFGHLGFARAPASFPVLCTPRAHLNPNALLLASRHRSRLRHVILKGLRIRTLVLPGLLLRKVLGVQLGMRVLSGFACATRRLFCDRHRLSIAFRVRKSAFQSN